ncbi:MAG: DUF4382 domain-containing protein [Actinomycetota bacterium]|nr:DUF4382 domain-containing protein [Actinomycetota bacterium]
MRKMSWLACVLLVVALLASVAVIGCGNGDSEEETASGETTSDTGTLEFTANGEDFAREGFTSKDGWDLSFDHFYITLDDIAAYQTEPPYDTEEGWEIESVEEVGLAGAYTPDLTDPQADPEIVGEVDGAPAGEYNSISWNVVEAESGEAEGYSIYLAGTAEKDGQTIDFTIKLTNELAYLGGEYVGDERKGILEAGDTAEVEMTFHLDHLFGDAETEADDALNVDALGFDPFVALATDGVVDVDTETLEGAWSAEDVEKLDEILLGLGHVGEGHCLCETLD